jgi:hypothetical protein
MMIVLKGHSEHREHGHSGSAHFLKVREQRCTRDRSLKANSLAAIFSSDTRLPVIHSRAPTASNVIFWVKHLETQGSEG